MRFRSLQEAKDFINQEAVSYIEHLLSLSSNIIGKDFIWHNNQAGTFGMFTDNGYDSTDPFAIQSLNKDMAAGYIFMIGFGGVMITPEGFENRGNW